MPVFPSGYAASHAVCVLPERMIAIFNAVDVGTPVTVFGRTPRGRAGFDSGITMQQRRRQMYDPRSEESFRLSVR